MKHFISFKIIATIIMYFGLKHLVDIGCRMIKGIAWTIHDKFKMSKIS